MLRRFGLAAVLLTACRSSHDGNGNPDAPTGDGIDAPGASASAEGHALGLNDISMLFRLPENFIIGQTIARMTGVPGYSGDLVPRDLFATLVSGPGDVAEPYESFHLVAMRFDLCDRMTATPCPDGADGRLRLVFQPLNADNGPIQAADVALHAFYPIPASELAGVVSELRALARLRDFQTASPLALNDFVASTSPPSEYRTRLRALIARYASADHLARLTLFAQDATAAPFNWIFRGAERTGSTFAPFVIPTITATQQRTVLVDSPWPPSFATSPVSDDPAGFQLAISTTAYRAATLLDRKAALGALAATQNPTLTSFGTMQCLGCHVSTFLLPARAAEDSIDPATVANVFTSQHDISTQFGVSKESATSLRAFGYFHQNPAISQRVANESAVVLDEIDQRFPPAPMTILPDAGVDTPPSVKRVFVASAQHNGDLKTAGGGVDGLDGADKLCATAAMHGNLGGQWKAWLSTSTVNAIDRLTGDGPWYLVDGTTLVFANKAAIASGPLVMIDRSEFGGQSSEPENTWTGTLANGTTAGAGHTCQDWTSNEYNTNIVDGMSGLWSNTTASWTAYGNATCSSGAMRLYCFEE